MQLANGLCRYVELAREVPAIELAPEVPAIDTGI
jgi:hypothetical protein